MPPRPAHVRPGRSARTNTRAVLARLHEPRFVDLAPAEVYATLLDEGEYLCSERTMYRVLAAQHEVRDRRDQLRHPRYAVPELLARRPNELWSWDITKLLGPAKWTYFYLYVMLDVFSRPSSGPAGVVVSPTRTSPRRISGDVQRSLLVRITRATTINDFVWL